MSVAEDRSGSGGIEMGIALPPERMARFRRWLTDAIAWVLDPHTHGERCEQRRHTGENIDEMPKRPPSESHHGSSRSAKRTSSASSSHGSSGSVEERPYSSGRHGSSGRMEEGTAAPSCRHRSRRTDKRPSSSGRHGSGRTANKHERPAPATRPRQRWKRKVDVNSFDPDAEFGSDSEAECQARNRDDEPSPLVRVEAPINYSRWITAHGSKIFMMLPVRAEVIPGIPVFDTVTRAMMVCPWPKNLGEQLQPFCVSVGDRLVRLCNPGFQVLGAQPPPRSGHGYVDVPWTWEEISDDNASSMPPFTSDRVSAYAVHPDGRTIWVSVSNWKPVVDGRGGGSYGDRNNTFTFDTEHLEWTHVGEWLMPFEGQAHYVGELDAWVGLSRVHKGYLCCCPNDGYGPWGEGPFTSRIGRTSTACEPPSCCTWARAGSAWSSPSCTILLLISANGFTEMNRR
uniref:Uncharacterized protein n=1 Tax=Oryza barthii TaxID=65489 RepID=A0A0D3FZW4_9ORYZ